jgi:hypothetical protein
MEIKILYFGGCPNWRTAAERAQLALVDLGRRDIPIQAEDVTQAQVVSTEWGGSRRCPSTATTSSHLTSATPQHGRAWTRAACI